MNSYMATVSMMPDAEMPAKFTRWGCTFRFEAKSNIDAIAHIPVHVLNCDLSDGDKKLRRYFRNGGGVVVRLENLGKVKT